MPVDLFECSNMVPDTISCLFLDSCAAWPQQAVAAPTRLYRYSTYTLILPEK